MNKLNKKFILIIVHIYYLQIKLFIFAKGTNV